MPKHPKKSEINEYIVRSKRYFFRFITFAYIFTMVAFIGFHLYFANKILPNVYVNDLPVGGLSFSDAERKIKENLSSKNTQFKIRVRDTETTITSETINFEFLPVATAKKAFSIGRSGSIAEDFKNKLLSILNPVTITPQYEYSDSNLSSVLKLIKIEALDEVREPNYKYENDELKIVSGKSGETFDEMIVKKELIKNFIYGLNNDISPLVTTVSPTLTTHDLVRLTYDVEKILDKNYVLVFNDYRWELDKSTVLSLVKPVKKSATDVAMISDKSAILDKLSDIALEVDRSPRGQVLEVEDGKAANFVASEDGLRLVIKDSYDVIERALFDGDGIDANEKLINLVVEVTTPPETANEYMIEDVLGVGTSEFVGSDFGRMHNIEVAAGKVSGILVEPGGIFSFVEAVGPIDKANGFTSAKVISGGRTVLGDGGGVCQVSTTVFRAALNAGLPIVERNAHSYRVSYYEQDSHPGLDATIYSPSVDLQFKNDTEGYILITSEFSRENATLKFNIYGKKDGRTIEMTKPKILSQTPPPEAQYIEDPNLDKGVQRTQEYPIWGAVVSFDRTVKKDGQVLYEDTFKSNYRAWGAVYLVGTKE